MKDSKERLLKSYKKGRIKLDFQQYSEMRDYLGRLNRLNELHD